MRTLLTALAALSLSGTVLAQDPVPPPHTRGWDLTEPVNVAEKAEFVTRWVSGLDTGDVPAAMGCFRFTNNPVRVMDIVFGEELSLFGSLYSHRLTDGYTVVDLLRDDEKVRHQFRDYVLTGSLATPLTDGDAQAVLKHFEAIQEALYGGGKYEPIDGYTVIDGKLVSNNLKLKFEDQPHGPLPALFPDGGDLCVHKWFIDCLPEPMILQCLRDHGLYVTNPDPQSPASDPDFDCDDFAWFTVNWLRRTLLKIYPGTEVTMYPVQWYCGTEKNGHALVKIQIGNLVWFYDPVSGEYLGPYEGPLLPGDEMRIIRQLMTNGHTGNCDNGEQPRMPFLPEDLKPKPWRWLPESWPESTPFDQPHTTPGIPHADCPGSTPDGSWEEFKRVLAICCGSPDIVHPGPMPNPPGGTSPGGVPGCPQTMPEDFEWPDLCDPENYTYPLFLAPQ